MRVFSFVLMALLHVAPIHAAASLQVDESPWVQQHVAAIAAAGGGGTARLWQDVARSGTPVIARDPADPAAMFVTFLHRVTADDSHPPAVFVPVDWDRVYPMRQIAKSDVWQVTLRLPSAYRGAYWLSWPQGRATDPRALTTTHIDGQPIYELFDDAIARHRAPHFDSLSRALGSYGWFEGPDAPPEPFLSVQPAVAAGRIETRMIQSARLGNARAVSIYTPPGHDPRRRGGYPLLLVFDRDEYMTTIGMPRMLDGMIASGAIPPVVAVFVGAISDPDRNRELPGNAVFQDFVHDDLLPPLESAFALSRDPARRIAVGASYGGLSATLLAHRFPASFGGVIAQSGAFWWGPAHKDDGSAEFRDEGEAARLYAADPRKATRFALTVGTLEGDIMVQPNRRLRDVLIAQGNAVTYREVAGAHDWISWRSLLPDALIAMLGEKR